MKWKIDTHKFPSEIIRGLLTVLHSHKINRQSADSIIRIAEKEMELKSLYGKGSSFGRTRRALFSYFESYKCMDKDGDITDFGLAFIDKKITLQEFCFWIATNYCYIEKSKKKRRISYFPLYWILRFLVLSEPLGNTDLILSLNHFVALQNINSRTEITDAFIIKTLADETKSKGKNARSVGFDIWTNILCTAGLLERTDKGLCLNQKRKKLISWLLLQYLSYQPTNSTALKDSIMNNIPIVELLNEKPSFEESVYRNEVAAIVAFFFGAIPIETIDKYIAKNVNILELIKTLGVEDDKEATSLHGFYKDFLGYEGLVGATLAENENCTIAMLGRILLDYNRNVPDPPASLPETINEPRNLIYQGAPGTGKSFQLREDSKVFGDCYERVTFHPDYTYSQFVGCYKPVTEKDKDKDKPISYKFVPGPFIRVLTEALTHKDKNYLLVIEEINRAKVAAVFGDVFQLLDRDKNGESEYPIAPSEELKELLGCQILKIPSNMYIWATMNSADQGVFPMDTAFRRRWSFKYIGIDDKEGDIPKTALDQQWNALRHAINDRLVSQAGCRVNEDKLLGPFFIKIDHSDDSKKDEKDYKSLIRDKVLTYLFDDAAKHSRSKIFKVESMLYSKIRAKFDNDGLQGVFVEEIMQEYNRLNHKQQDTTSTQED